MVQEHSSPSFDASGQEANDVQNLRSRIESSRLQIFSDPLVQSATLNNVGEDWKEYLPTLAEEYPQADFRAGIHLMPRPNDELNILIGSPFVEINYKVSQTSFTRPVNEGQRFVIQRRKTSSEPEGETTRLRMVLEILEYALLQQRLDQTTNSNSASTI